MKKFLSILFMSSFIIFGTLSYASAADLTDGDRTPLSEELPEYN